MKVKHIIISHIALAILLTLLIGCEKTDLTRKIESWQIRHPDRDGDCMIYAMRAKAYYDRLGVDARICHGYYKGKKHAWCEYADGEEWIVDDKAVGNKGYTVESYTTLGRPDYELSWWGK